MVAELGAPAPPGIQLAESDVGYANATAHLAELAPLWYPDASEKADANVVTGTPMSHHWIDSHIVKKINNIEDALLQHVETFSKNIIDDLTSNKNHWDATNVRRDTFENQHPMTIKHHNE